MEHVEVGGARIPRLGLGTWQNTGERCTEIVRTALELGYRHVDTAQSYGNETAVGEGIATADIDREELFLTTKVRRSNLRADDLRPSVEESLDRLGVEYVDLLLIHWPHPWVPFEESLGAMAELREEGRIEHVGVSNFTSAQLETALDAVNAPIVADQVLYHPYKDQSDLLELCAERGVALTAYSPLARGAVLSDETLSRIGERYEKTPAQVALRWLIQQEGVVAIPKASSQEHLAENLAIFDFSLTDEEMNTIHDLDGGGLRIRLGNRLPALMRRFPL